VFQLAQDRQLCIRPKRTTAIIPRANQQGPSRRKRGLLRATKHRWPNTSLVIDQRRAPFFSACVGMVLVKAQLYVCWHEVGLQLLCYVHAKDCKLCPPPLPDLVLVLGLVSWRCLPVTRIWPLLFLHYRDNAKLK
jgi:hypothetical protein